MTPSKHPVTTGCPQWLHTTTRSPPPTEVGHKGPGNGLSAVQAKRSRVLSTWARLDGKCTCPVESWYQGRVRGRQSRASKAQGSRQGAHLPTSKDEKSNVIYSTFRIEGDLSHRSPRARTHTRTHTGRPLPFTPSTCCLCWTPAGMHVQSTQSRAARE